MLDLEAGDTDKAIAHLERYIRLNPEDPAANYNLAGAYKQKGDAAREAFYSARYFGQT